MKKATKKSMKMSASKMKADKAKNMKAMSPQDKFKAMLEAKKKGGKSKLSYGKSAGKKANMKMSVSKKTGKK